MKKNLLKCLFLSLSLCLVGCQNPLNAHYKNIQLAILLNQDAELSLQDVKDSEVDLAFIKSGDRPLAVIAKAFTEFNKEKWISEDKAMLVFSHHRVIRTVGFKNDQLAIFSGDRDPLSDLSSIATKNWYWEVDWSVGEYGYPVQSQFAVKSDSVEVFGNTFTALHVVEKVRYKKAEGLFNTSEWDNHYWIDKETGMLLKTSQQSAPFSDRFDITFVSNAVRLMKDQGQIN